jgi:hypothetical protein
MHRVKLTAEAMVLVALLKSNKLINYLMRSILVYFQCFKHVLTPFQLNFEYQLKISW